MSSPSIAVFDLGKVLVDFDYAISAGRIAAKSRKGVDAVRFFIDHSPLLFRYEVGQLTTEQFFDEVCKLTGFRGTQDQFGEFFADIFTPIPSMVELHAAVRKKGLPTFIFSNTNYLAISHIQHRFPFYDTFDGHVLSYEHGAMKPDAKLYEVVEKMTKRSGKEIIYIDDRPENVEAGKIRGWNVVLHETPEKTREAMERLGAV